MAHVVAPDVVAFVRLAEGGTVKLHAGDTVPVKAAADHVAALTRRGVLVAKEPKGSRSGGSSGSGDQS